MINIITVKQIYSMYTITDQTVTTYVTRDYYLSLVALQLKRLLVIVALIHQCAYPCWEYVGWVVYSLFFIVQSMALRSGGDNRTVVDLRVCHCINEYVKCLEFVLPVSYQVEAEQAVFRELVITNTRVPDTAFSQLEIDMIHKQVFRFMSLFMNLEMMLM